VDTERIVHPIPSGEPKPPRFLDRVRLAIGARPYPLKSEHALRHATVYTALGVTTHPLKDGYDIRSVQDLLAHNDVSTMMIYTHVLNRGPAAVRSPADRRATLQSLAPVPPQAIGRPE
jgi:integrase